MKRVLVIADTHCGHEVGLTPDRYNITLGAHKERKAYWKEYQRIIQDLGRIDLLVANGDLIDGRGERSGSTELIHVDRKIQCRMAEEVIKEANAKQVIIIRGTDYHTGAYEEWEDIIGDLVDAIAVDNQKTVDVNGLMMNFKHKVSSSSVPHGRATALLKEHLWNTLWADAGGIAADVIVRSHVHYHAYAGSPGKLAIITPALQGLGSRYGTKQCSGIVDWGVVVFEVHERGSYTWEAITKNWLKQKAVVV